jgi:hypothetical protein
MNRNDKKLEPPYIPDLRQKTMSIQGELARAKMLVVDKIKVNS